MARIDKSGQARVARLSFLSFALLCLAACSPPTELQAPQPGSLAAARRSIRSGNLPALKSNLGLVLFQRAGVRPLCLDPEAWLVLQGANWREHDLKACYNAAGVNELPKALGLSDDALTVSLLTAPSRLSDKTAGGRRYFLAVEPPLNLLDALEPDPFAKPGQAWVLRYKAILGERTCTLRLGFDHRGVTELHAEENPFDSSPTRKGGSKTDLAAMLHELAPSVAQGLNGAPIPRQLPQGACSLEVRGVNDSGTLFELHALALERGWQILYARETSLAERLRNQSDDDLRLILEAALEHERRFGNWPAPSDLSLPAGNWVDVAAKSGELGWQRYAKQPVAGFGLAAKCPGNDEPAVFCLEGKRGITRKGHLIN